jgi:hypothetical protein
MLPFSDFIRQNITKTVEDIKKSTEETIEANNRNAAEVC